MLLEGRWTLQEIAAPRQSHTKGSRTCPEWPQLMGLAPQLQFKHTRCARRSCWRTPL